MAIKEGLLILLIIGISDCYTSNRCPKINYLSECRCKEVAYDVLDLVCDDFISHRMTIQDYMKIFQEIKIAGKRNLRIDFVTLAANSTIPSRVFEGLDIRALQFSYGEKISMWADEEGGPAFVGLENTLENITFWRSLNIPRKYDDYQQQKAPMSLGHLRKLRVVKFSYNEINTFANGWFDKGPSSLERLLIEWCNIRYLGDRAFASLTNLKEIVMTHNEFESLPRSMFPNPANHLEKMDLEYNKLKYFPDDFFTNMPSLKYVYLTNNRITHLPEIIWLPVWSQLDSLTLSYNPLDCGEYISWMFEAKPPKTMWGVCDKPSNMANVELFKFIKRKQGGY